MAASTSAPGKADPSLQELPQCVKTSPLLVDSGQITDAVRTADSGAFGKTLGDTTFVWRSGVGIRADGSIVTVHGNALSVQTLAQLLLDAGAVRAMQLDINRDWTSPYRHAPAFAPGQAHSRPGAPAGRDLHTLEPRLRRHRRAQVAGGGETDRCGSGVTPLPRPARDPLHNTRRGTSTTWLGAAVIGLVQCWRHPRLPVQRHYLCRPAAWNGSCQRNTHQLPARDPGHSSSMGSALAPLLAGLIVAGVVPSAAAAQPFG